MSEVATFRLATGLLADLAADSHPARLSAWANGALSLDAGATHMGFVHEGPARLDGPSGTFDLHAGMVFCVPGAARIEGTGAGIAVSRLGFDGLFSIAGPIEAKGRLRYIDGCTDTLLIPPVIKGDPCLNLLHIPAGTRQSRHTHPSVRVGMIAAGTGRCVTPGRAHDLTPGLVFIIPSHSLHCFHTDADSLSVIAWHPDSDTGPTHEDHPMINRTCLEGHPAPGATQEERADAR